MAKVLWFRLLWHGFTVSVPDDDVADALGFLVQDATQRVDLRRETTVDVRSTGAGFEIAEDGNTVGRAVDARAVLDVVYQLVHARCFDDASRAGWVRAHGALVEVGGQRMLLGGRAGAGKTTLALRLLYDGHGVQGDESVLLRDGTAIAVARPFHLKPGVADHVPEVEALLPSLPRLDEDPPIWAFDPTRAGFSWEISPGPVDAVVVIERGPDTRLERVVATEVMHDIVRDVFLLHESKGTVIRQVATVFRHAAAYRLTLGEVGAAASLLRGLGSAGLDDAPDARP